MNQNNYIAHWGIKGMKWGIRRYQNADGTLTEAGKKRRRQTNMLDEVRSMSDDELKKKIDRAINEEKYIDTMQKIVSKTTKPKFFQTIIKDIGGNTVKNIGGQLSVYLVGQAINKIAKKVGASGPIVNPKKGQKDK